MHNLKFYELINLNGGGDDHSTICCFEKLKDAETFRAKVRHPEFTRIKEHEYIVCSNLKEAEDIEKEKTKLEAFKALTDAQVKALGLVRPEGITKINQTSTYRKHEEPYKGTLYTENPKDKDNY